MDNAKKNYRRIDIIRAISCVFVLLYHLNILKGGFLAVCTFFALSGYLRFQSALSKTTFSFSKYYSKRFKSIYLPLLVVISITILITKCIDTITWVSLKPETISALFGYNNFWQLKANMDYFARHINSPFMHLWYISILIQFDLLFPFIFMAFEKVNQEINENASCFILAILSIISIIIFLIMGYTKGIMFAYYNTFARVFSILLGALLANVHYNYGTRCTKLFIKKHNLLFLLYSVIFIVLCFLNPENKNTSLYLIILATIISIRWIDYSIINPNRRALPGQNKLISVISKISYEVYLIQYPIIFFLQYTSINSIIKTLIVIILTIILSYIIHFFLDFKSKKKYLKVVCILCTGIILCLGAYTIANEKDNTAELKELEQNLEENSAIMEENNNNYLEYDNNESEVIPEEQKVEETPVQEDERDANLENVVHNLPVVGIGDSVLLGAAKDLHKQFPNGYFDGKVSRNLKGGEDLIKELKSKGKLGDTVILALANNGEFSSKRLTAFFEVIGDRQIYWVNAVGADDPNYNAQFEEFAKAYPNIHIVDWYSTAKPEFLYADKVHPKEGVGTAAYAQLIFDAIYEEYRKTY